MLVSQLIDNIQSTLADKAVYRPDAFVLEAVNHGHKLTSVLALFDERRSSITISGTRNMTGLPLVNSSEMIAPIYVANTTTGSRVNPVSLEELELYASEWETVVDGTDVDYYTVLSPYHNAETMLWCAPVPTTGTTNLTIVGACVPVDLTATDTPRLSEAYQDILYHYGVFAGFASEPNRAQDAAEAYKLFVQRVNNLIADIKSRFPSGQGFKPRPVEFKYDNVTRSQQKADMQTAQTEKQDESR